MDDLGVNVSTTSEAAVEALKTAILDGRLRPGEPLKEAQLATRMGISRGPLREALAQLVHQRLVTREPYRGATVAVVSERQIAAIAEVRAVVEPVVMQMSLTRNRKAVMSELDAALKAMRDAPEGLAASSTVTAHVDFHGAFYNHCGNPILSELWRSWGGQLQLFFILNHESYADLGALHREHVELERVWKEGDLSEISASVQVHLASARRKVVDENLGTAR